MDIKLGTGPALSAVFDISRRRAASIRRMPCRPCTPIGFEDNNEFSGQGGAVSLQFLVSGGHHFSTSIAGEHRFVTSTVDPRLPTFHSNAFPMYDKINDEIVRFFVF
jgi:hypothetical protein